MKFRKPNLSPITRDRWKKLAPAIIAVIVVGLAFPFVFGVANRTSNVDVYALAVGVGVAEGELFSDLDLRIVKVPSDGALLDNLVPAQEGLIGQFTAVRTLPPGSFLGNRDYVVGEPLPENGDVPLESDNWVALRVPLSWGLGDVVAGEVLIPPGNIWIVTDQLPPRHIACIQFLGLDGSPEALVAPKDLPALSIWIEANRAVPIQQTSDACPLGETPRLCGILTNALDPADLLDEEQRVGGFVYAEDVLENDLDVSFGVPTLELPECRSDDGRGVFDRPEDLTADFCSKISLAYLARIGIDPIRLDDCAGAEDDETGSQQNPGEEIDTSADVELLLPSSGEEESGEDADVAGEETDELGDTGDAGVLLLDSPVAN